MVDSLASFAAKVELFVILLLCDHDRFIKRKITMGTCDFCQEPSLSWWCVAPSRYINDTLPKYG
jgi:hypothetical protein